MELMKTVYYNVSGSVKYLYPNKVNLSIRKYESRNCNFISTTNFSFCIKINHVENVNIRNIRNKAYLPSKR